MTFRSAAAAFLCVRTLSSAWCRPVIRRGHIAAGQWFAALVLCFVAPLAMAENLPATAASLGQTRDEVEASLAGLQAVKAPRRLPGGLTGLLQSPDVVCEGLHFSETLYFKAQALEQIELLWLQEGGAASAPSSSADAFGHLLDALRARFGAELASAASTRETVMETASWVSGNANVMLYRSGRADHPVVRLVVRQRRLVDAGEL